MRSDIRHDQHRRRRALRFRLRRLAWLAASAAVVAVVAPAVATADSVYHSGHLSFASVGGAPLQSGFVENIKAEGPTLYAHEIFVLNGAQPNTTYVVTRDFYFLDPECDGSLVFHEDVATLQTNAAGNAQGDAVIEPRDVAGFEGVHGVRWTVRTGGTVVYQTPCTAVTLD